MLSYTIRRLLVAVPIILILVISCFFRMHLAPGGPFTSERQLPPEVLANIETLRFGLTSLEATVGLPRKYRSVF